MPYRATCTSKHVSVMRLRGRAREAGERLTTWTTVLAGREPLLDPRKTPKQIKGTTYPRESWRNLKMNRILSASQAGRFVPRLAHAFSE